MSFMLRAVWVCRRSRARETKYARHLGLVKLDSERRADQLWRSLQEEEVNRDALVRLHSERRIAPNAQ